jgi:hypothetical protein
MSKRTALINGITGQDGSYLAELLLEKGYAVHGIVRRVANEDADHRLWRVKHILNDITLQPASLESYPSLCRVMSHVKPDEIYHLPAQSFVSYSFENEFSTLNANINGTHYHEGQAEAGLGIRDPIRRSRAGNGRCGPCVLPATRSLCAAAAAARDKVDACAAVRSYHRPFQIDANR